MRPPQNASAAAKRQPGYTKQPHDLITASEAVRIIDHRVSVLLAHWEDQRRKRERESRWHRRAWRWLAVTVALLRPARPARGVSLRDQIMNMTSGAAPKWKAGAPPAPDGVGQSEEVI